jgi:hypothetical protein
MNPQD